MSKITDIYKTLGNETRLLITKELARRGTEVAGCQILPSCSKALNLAQPTLSQHFAKLVACGVIIERKQGVEKFYRLDNDVLEKAGIEIDTIIKNEEV